MGPETAAYPQLYAGIGKETIGLAGWFIPFTVGPALGIGGSIVGHTTGRYVANQRSQQIELVRAERRRGDEALAELAAFEAENVDWLDPEVTGVILPAGGEADAASTGSVTDGQLLEPAESPTAGLR